MARCDLCEGSCRPEELRPLLDSYRSPGLVDLCGKCAEWADETKFKRMAEASDKVRADISARRASPRLTLGQRLLAAVRR